MKKGGKFKVLALRKSENGCCLDFGKVAALASCSFQMIVAPGRQGMEEQVFAQ